jgi:chromosome segregation ATPase
MSINCAEMDADEIDTAMKSLTWDRDRAIRERDEARGLLAIFRLRIKELEDKLAEVEAQWTSAALRNTPGQARDRIESLEKQLVAVEAQAGRMREERDAALLHPSDPKSCWKGINAELRGWQIRAEKAEKERDEARAKLVEANNQIMEAEARFGVEAAQGMNEAVRMKILQSERDDLGAPLDFPMRDIVFAATIHGGTEEDGPWLVTLVCGHKVAVRKRRVSYPCGECQKGKP